MQESAITGGTNWRGCFRTILWLGLPLVGSQLAQTAINTTDVLIIGHLGPLELAGIILATQYFFLILFFGTGFSTAIMPLIAHAVGREDDDEVRRVVQTGIWISLAFSGFSLPLFLYSEAILLSLGQAPDVSAKAAIYLRLVGFGIAPALVFQVLKSFLSVLGRTRIVFYINVVCVALNALFAYTFTLGHFGSKSYGLTGAALTAVGVETLFALSLAAYIFSIPACRRYGLSRHMTNLNWAAFVEVIRHGVPISLMILSEMSLFSVAAIMVGWFGPIKLAAHGIAMQLAAISFMVPLGLSQATTILIGISAGRRDVACVRRIGIAALILACVFALTSGGILIASARHLAAFFVDSNSANTELVIQQAIPFITVAGIFQLFDSLQVVGAGLARGLKDSTVPMILSVASYWIIGFCCAYLLAFPMHFDGIGIWAGFVAGLAAAAISLNIRFAVLARQLSRQCRLE